MNPSYALAQWLLVSLLKSLLTYLSSMMSLNRRGLALSFTTVKPVMLYLDSVQENFLQLNYWMCLKRLTWYRFSGSKTGPTSNALVSRYNQAAVIDNFLSEFGILFIYVKYCLTRKIIFLLESEVKRTFEKLPNFKKYKYIKLNRIIVSGQ